MRLIDLTGQRFGHLTVIERDMTSKKNAKWICKCDCGAVVIKSGQGLRNGESTYCGNKECSNKKERFENLRNQRFTRLIALEPTDERINNSVVWKCKCDCGNYKNVPAISLKTGGTKSCGCLKQETDRMAKGNVKDILGQKFDHLTVIARDGSDKNGQAKWLCECDCKNHNIISVLGDNLRRGHTISCGCERASHGEVAVAALLIKNNINFETEKSFFNYENGHRAPFDFWVNNQYIIEYDGETHDVNYANKHGWFTDESVKKQLERDTIKNQWCKEHNIPLIRIPYTHLKDLCIEDLKLETTSFLMK